MIDTQVSRNNYFPTLSDLIYLVIKFDLNTYIMLKQCYNVCFKTECIIAEMLEHT